VIGARLERERPPERAWDTALDVQLERQNGLNWCWAAVTKGIVEYYGGPILEQCEYATRFLRQTISCCGAETEARCDAPFPVDEALAAYGHFAPPPYRRPIGLSALRRELERDRPIVALMSFPRSFHAVAITAVHLAERRIGFCDPLLGAGRSDLDAETFATAYGCGGRWAYTMLTRPASTAPRGAVSFLRERLPEPLRRVPQGGSRPMDIPFYEADLAALADGTGLQTAARHPDRSVALFADDRAGASFVELGIAALRDEIEARLEVGYEVRLVQCFAVKLTVLWFVRPGESSRRSDHYLVLPPAPYYLESGREYGAPELAASLAAPARIAVRSQEATAAFLARLDRETALQPEP
jgi:hypothetical protein